MWVDALIIGLLGFGVYSGAKRGLIMVAAELSSLLLAMAIAALTYRPLAGWLAASAHAAPSFSGVLALSIIIALFQLLGVLVIGIWLRRLPPATRTAAWNQVGGAGLNLARTALVVVLGLIVFSALPLGATTKSQVTDGLIPKLIQPYTAQLQQAFNRQFGKSLSDTINFFTVAPQSEESISLGFSTTRVHIDAAAETRMLGLVNHERTSRGLQPLVMNEKARAVARAYSRDMFARGYFSHINPEGQDPFERMAATGIQFGAAGENLALAPTLDQAHSGLMNSPGHRANILSPDYRTVGIGIVDSGPYGLMVTQDFTD